MIVLSDAYYITDNSNVTTSSCTATSYYANASASSNTVISWDENCTTIDTTAYSVYTLDDTITTTGRIYRQIAAGTVYVTGTASGNFGYYSLSKKDLLKSKIAGNLADNRTIKVPRNTPEEIKAQELLREMVTSKEFREYLTKGKLTVIGRTNLKYVIRPGYQMVQVFAKDKLGKYRIVEKLCVIYKDGKIPPTDAVIMRKLMIEHDEFAFRSLANVFKVADHNEFDQHQVSALRARIA